MRTIWNSHSKAAAAVAVLVASFASIAAGEVLDFEANLDGAQMVPPVITGGTGHADVVIDTDANTIALSITYENLEGGAIDDIHVHGFAPEGQNAPILEHIHEEDLGDFPIEHEFTYSEIQEPFYLQGLSYLVIHTEEFPDGEIRGQIVAREPVSVETSTWGGIKNLYR